MTLRQRLGHRLLQLRDRRDWTLRAAAAKAGLSHVHLVNLEHGRVGVSLESLAALADAYGVTLAELFENVHPPCSEKES